MENINNKQIKQQVNVNGLLRTAINYQKAKLSILPTYIDSKRPVIKSWNKYQENAMSLDEVKQHFNNLDSAKHGIGLICGTPSQNLEVIDFDNKLGNIKEIFNDFCKIPDVQTILKKYSLPIEETQSKGFHIAYRCENVVSGSQKLAQDKNDKGKTETLIETRGEGAYFIAAPTNKYKLLKGSFEDIPVITDKERDLLLSYAKSYNKVFKEPPPVKNNYTKQPDTFVRNSWDDYNADSNALREVKQLLQEHNWSYYYSHGTVEYWTRPDKKSGISATFGKVADNVFYVFSSNAQPFEPNHGYQPFHILTLLKYNGDYQSAAKDLFKQGYGKLSQKKPKRTDKTKSKSKPVNQHNDKNIDSFIMDSDDPVSFFDEYRFFIKDSQYYIFKTTGKGDNTEEIEIEISDFCMEFLYRLNDGTNNQKRLIKLQQKNNGNLRHEIIELKGSDLKLDKFKNEALRSAGMTTFGYSPYSWDKIYKYNYDNEKIAETIEIFGYQPNFDVYALSNAIITKKGKVLYPDELGIISGSKTSFYLAPVALSNKDNKSFNGIRMFRYKKGNINFETFANQYYNAYGINGSIGISYLILSLFRDIVFKELRFFPFLFLFGAAGTAKTSFISLLLQIFGDKPNGVPLKNSTSKKISRSLAQKANAIEYCKEYSNRVDNNLVDVFKNGYDGILYGIAEKTTDNSTKDYLIEQGVIIDGNELPDREAAMFSRMFVISFEKTTFSEKETNAYKFLKKEANKGLGQILAELFQYRDLFKDKFKACFDELVNELKNEQIDFNGKKLAKVFDKDRIINHIALFLTPYKILFSKINFGIDYQELVGTVLEYAIEQQTMMNENKPQAIFWQSVEWCKKKYPHLIEEGKTYIKEDSYLYVKLNDFYTYYSEYCKINHIDSSSKTSLKKLLTSPSYIPFVANDQNNGKYKTKQFNKWSFGRCYKFKYESTNSKAIIIDNNEYEI